MLTLLACQTTTQSIVGGVVSLGVFAFIGFMFWVLARD